MKKTLPIICILFYCQIFLLGQTIKMVKEGGVYKVPCKINGLSLSFIIDTGASNVMISLTEAMFMLKNGYLLESDLSETEKYKIANGQIAEGTKVNLRSVQIGANTLTNVEASVIHNIDAPLLFGLSALQRFGKVEMDYKLGTLNLGEKSDKPQNDDAYSTSNQGAIYGARGIAKADLQDYRGAIADFNKVIELDPNDANAYRLRGLAKADLQDYRGAIADFNKVIELDPNDAFAYRFRGIAKAELQDYRGAIADFNKVIELDPNDANTYYIRGYAKIQLNQKESACSDFSKAGELGNEKAYEEIKKYCN